MPAPETSSCRMASARLSLLIVSNVCIRFSRRRTRNSISDDNSIERRNRWLKISSVSPSSLIWPFSSFSLTPVCVDKSSLAVAISSIFMRMARNSVSSVPRTVLRFSSIVFKRVCWRAINAEFESLDCAYAAVKGNDAKSPIRAVLAMVNFRTDTRMMIISLFTNLPAFHVL